MGQCLQKVQQDMGFRDSENPIHVLLALVTESLKAVISTLFFRFLFSVEDVLFC